MVKISDPDQLDRFQVAIDPIAETLSFRGLGTERHAVDQTGNSAGTTTFTDASLWREIVYPAGSGNVDAGGNVSVTAIDDASIDATTALITASSADNDFGTGVLDNLAGTLLDAYQFTTNSGLQDVVFGDKVRLADDYAGPPLLLPPVWREWTESQRRAVLAHEIAHVRSGDFLSILVAQVGLLLHFYHPLVHWLDRLGLPQPGRVPGVGHRRRGPDVHGRGALPHAVVVQPLGR